MFLLIPNNDIPTFVAPILPLHSIMFLLIPDTCLGGSVSGTFFTFHNVSINTKDATASAGDVRNFTFHNVSINTTYTIRDSKRRILYIP